MVDLMLISADRGHHDNATLLLVGGIDLLHCRTRQVLADMIGSSTVTVVRLTRCSVKPPRAGSSPPPIQHRSGRDARYSAPATRGDSDFFSFRRKIPGPPLRRMS